MSGSQVELSNGITKIELPNLDKSETSSANVDVFDFMSHMEAFIDSISNNSEDKDADPENLVQRIQFVLQQTKLLLK